jgi:hypothetical protein
MRRLRAAPITSSRAIACSSPCAVCPDLDRDPMDGHRTDT